MSRRQTFIFDDEEALEYGSGSDGDNDNDNDDGEEDMFPIETAAALGGGHGEMPMAGLPPTGNGNTNHHLMQQQQQEMANSTPEQVWERVTTFIRETQGMPPSELCRYLSQMLDLRSDEGEERLPINPCELQARLWTKLVMPAQKAMFDLCYDPMTGQTQITREYAEVLYRLNAVNMMLYFAHEFTYPGPRIAHNVMQVLYDAAPIPVPVLLDDKSKVRAWCLTKARQGQLGHADGYILRKKYLHNGEIDTHYWERVSPVAEYFQNLVDPMLHPHIMQIFTKNSNVFKDLETVLCTNHLELPLIKRNRRFASCEDGIYDTYTDYFYPYGPAIKEIPLEPDESEVVSSVFIHGAMGPWYGQPLLGFEYGPEICEENAINYRIRQDFVPLPTFRQEIPTPLFDTLMDTQQWDEDVQFWFMYLFGRLIHPINKHDKCQVATLMYGIARSGKSVFLEIARDFLPHEKVGQIESHGEKTFGPGNLHGKWMWQCSELETDTNLDTGFIKQLIEGAKIVAAKKYKDAFDLIPEGHGIIATNNDIALSGMFGGNSQGAIARRFVTFPFFYLPTNIHSNLHSEIHDSGELIRIFRKCNMIYLIGNQLLQRMFRGDIWKALPQSIIDQRDHMMVYSAEIYEFIMHHPNIMLGPECVVTMRDLRNEFDAWQSGEGSGGNGGSGGGGSKRSKLKWTPQLYQAVFQRLRCEVKKVFYNEGSENMVVDLSIKPEDRDYTRFDRIREAMTGSRAVYLDEPTEHGSQRAEEMVFNIGIGMRDPTRVIPSFVQRVLVPDADSMMRIDDLERCVEYFRDKLYPNEKQYVWQPSYMLYCLEQRQFQVDAMARVVYARIGQF